MVSMEAMNEPITAEEHRAFVVRTALIAIGIVLLVAIFFVLRDYRRKRHYLHMSIHSPSLSSLVTCMPIPR